MKKKYYIIATILVLALQACDEFVDIEPRGSAIAASLEDVNALLDNGTRISVSENVVAILLSDNLQISEERLVLFESDQETVPFSNIYNLEPLFYEGLQEDPVWQNHYAVIGFVNNIIQVLEDLDTDDPLKNSYMAEAKVHRAYHYFNLVSIYGVHYGLPEAAQAASGVPIVTVFSDDQVSLVRASVNEVYDFILNDLDEALPFLEETVISNDRPSLGAALGLLGEVELHRGNYASALEHFNDALAFNSNLIDYNTDLVELFGSSVLPMVTENPENLLVKIATPAGGFFIDPIASYSDELLAITDIDNDLRFTEFVQENAFGNFQLNENYLFSTGVTVPRLMLFQAECLARTGNFTEAMNVVNNLRSKRFNADFVFFGDHLLSAANADEAINHIIDESRREFHISGQRLFDIKRLNAIENAGISLTRNGTTYAPNSINWAAPISQNVINTSNGQITQNTRE